MPQGNLLQCFKIYFFLSRVDGESDLGAIVDDLCATFEAERGQVLNDCSAFLQQLVDRRMVVI